jgi:hypothetical protein
LMRSLLSQFQTPTTPRRAVGFFGSGRSPGHPSELITQLTLDWPLFILANPFSRRRGKVKTVVRYLSMPLIGAKCAPKNLKNEGRSPLKRRRL